MKGLALLIIVSVLAASCRRTSTCTCKTRDGWGQQETVTSTKGDIEQFENECRQKRVQESDGTTSPCKVS